MYLDDFSWDDECDDDWMKHQKERLREEARRLFGSATKTSAPQNERDGEIDTLDMLDEADKLIGVEK